MKDLKIALILSNNSEVRRKLSDLLKQIDISFIFESTQSNAMFRVLDLNLIAVFIDLDVIDDDSLEFIRFIRIFRKRVKVITISNPLSKKEYQNLLEAGSDHCFLKSVRVNEIFPIVRDFIGLV
jgi:DNA-binding NarL/FixJ family response regulator